MTPDPSNADLPNSDTSGSLARKVFASGAEPSGLIVCCGAFLGLVLGMSLTLVLLKHLGVVYTCTGLMSLFLAPLLWALCRKEQTTSNSDKQSIPSSLDQTWVISFWCVCSLVLLLVATM